jgi:tetratricopeptide (TPR) repeat protein
MKAKLFISILATLVLAGGCTSPEEKAERRLDEAVALREAGKVQGALFALEALNEDFPDDPRVLRQIGLAYGELDEPTNAAFFLDQAVRLDPSNTDLLREACSALIAAGDRSAAAERLGRLALDAPQMLRAEEWFLLGASRARRNETQPALDAYLRGVSLQSGKPKPATALAIGGLFVRLDNLAQGERWLRAAAAPGDSNALPALLGLLEIHLRTENWEEAETAVAALDEQFPGALDASEWAGARAQLKGWRDAREAMQAALEKAPAAGAEEVSAGGKEETGAVAETGEDGAAVASAPADGPGGKEAAVRELERAEALARTAAVAGEPGDETDEAAADGEPAGTEQAEEIAFNPNIAVEPAEPGFGIEVTYDGQSGDVPVALQASLADEAAPASPSAPARADPVAELMAEGDAALRAADTAGAIRSYWRAVGLANGRADLWNRLSRAYLAAGQAAEAETTALESIRLQPENPVNTLDYLRAVQGSRKGADMLAEIEAAQARFPRHPEIALSLARAYERIAGDDASARTMYRSFIALAPDHPLVPEAEAALRRLR